MRVHDRQEHTYTTKKMLWEKLYNRFITIDTKDIKKNIWVITLAFDNRTLYHIKKGFYDYFNPVSVFFL